MTSLLMSLLNPAPYVPSAEDQERSRHVNYGKAFPLVKAAFIKLKKADTNSLAKASGISVRRVRYTMQILVNDGVAKVVNKGRSGGKTSQFVWEIIENASATATPSV